MKLTSDFTVNLGVLGEHIVTVGYYATPYEPASIDSPAVDAEVDIAEIMKDGTDLFEVIECGWPEQLEKIREAILKGESHEP